MRSVPALFVGCIAVISVEAHEADNANAGAPSQVSAAQSANDAAPIGSDERTTRVLVLSPKAADHSDATHAALLISKKSYSGRILFGGRVQTVKQLRIGSLPNPWECAWLVWNYQNDEHFYYLAIKSTGWELGKRDPAYPGGQRFLASGEGDFRIGAWHGFLITQENEFISIRVNGDDIVSYADTERPYTDGKLGLYTEDAEVSLDDINAPFVDDFENYEPLTDTADGFAMNNWSVPFLGHGYVAVADRGK